MKRTQEWLAVQDDIELETIAKMRRIPNLGRAIKAANTDAAAPAPVERPHQLKGKLTKASFEALMKHLYEEKIKGRPVTLEYLIANGLKLQGIEIDAADLALDRRKA